MKRKLATIAVLLTLGLGYCKPPVEDCVGFPQSAAVCRGVIKPSVPIIVRPK